MKEFWNNRYAEADFAYGAEPNEFLKKHLDFLPKGKILFPAEGEGRNAVFTAQNSREVYAFDMSEEGKKKALELAETKNVSLQYEVCSAMEMPYEFNSFDGLVLIYAHFPKPIRKEVHQKLLTLLKPGGKIIFEAFSKEQLKYQSGGPKDEEMLFSEEEIKEEFEGVEFEKFEKKIITLNEGKYHQGEGAIIRFLGTKDEEDK